MTTKHSREPKIGWVAPVVLCATLLAYCAWWGIETLFRDRDATALAQRLSYSDAALLDRFSNCNGSYDNCRREIGFTTATPFEEFRHSAAALKLTNTFDGSPTEPVRIEGTSIFRDLGDGQNDRIVDSQGRGQDNGGAAPGEWQWVGRDERGRFISISFYETAGKGYRFD
ncbi:MAG: hypothetical protein H7Y32_14145, partial [Chloroflexales bacterium]|nr:hypothetical protein [Chloroflexales bacterium]